VCGCNLRSARPEIRLLEGPPEGDPSDASLGGVEYFLVAVEGLYLLPCSRLTRRLGAPKTVLSACPGDGWICRIESNAFSTLPPVAIPAEGHIGEDELPGLSPIRCAGDALLLPLLGARALEIIRLPMAN